MVSINRALNCSRKMACSDLDELADELIKSGIMTNAEQCESGEWKGTIDTTRVFNHDDTPQFINFGVDGSVNGLVYAGRGETCQHMVRENRECITVHPFVSFSGEVHLCHVIFKGKGLTSQMAPEKTVEKIPNLLASSSDGGSQDHNTLLAAYQKFDAILLEKNIPRPMVILSDGHSFRFDSDVLQFLRDKEMHLFITRPDTTGVTQLLDQVNHALHNEYRNCKAELFTHAMTINRERFMTVLGDLWLKWATSESLIKAGKRDDNFKISLKQLYTVPFWLDLFFCYNFSCISSCYLLKLINTIGFVVAWRRILMI